MMTGGPITCVGAAHWDIIAQAGGELHPGADVPGGVTRRPGGVAANIALALAALGIPVALVAAIGRDPEGDALAAALAAAGVDCTPLLRHSGATDSYVAVETAGGTLHAAVADCRGLERHAAPLLATAARHAGALVIDGNLPLGKLTWFLETARPARALVAASPAKAGGLGRALAAGGTTIYANRREAEAICGAPLADARSAAAALVDLGAAAALITDGAGTAAWAGAGSVVAQAPPPVAPRSVTGAGDMLVAAHLKARRAGATPAEALREALDAAARHIATAA